MPCSSLALLPQPQDTDLPLKGAELRVAGDGLRAKRLRQRRGEAVGERDAGRYRSPLHGPDSPVAAEARYYEQVPTHRMHHLALG